MLRRIHNLEVRDIKSLNGEHSFDFDDRITVIHGENGIGKTTIAQILMLTLVRSARGDVIKNLLTPVTGGSPQSKVTFSTDDGKYLISKTWGDANQTKLIDINSMQIISEGGKAEDMAASLAFEMDANSKSKRDGLISLLNSSVENYMASLTFHSQGNLHLAPKMGTHLRNIGLAVDQAELSKAFEKIEGNANDEAKFLISSILKSGEPKKGATGVLLDQRSKVHNLINRLEEATEISNNLQRAEMRLFDLEQNQQNVSEDNRAELRNKIKALRDGIKSHRELREKASEELRKFKEQFEPIKNEHEKRLKLVQDFNIKEKSFNIATDKSNESSIVRKEAKNMFEESKSSIEIVVDQNKLTNDWVQYLSIEENKDQLKIALNRAKKDLNSLSEDEAKLKQIKDSLKALKLPDSSNWTEIRKLEGEIKSIEITKTMNVRLNKDVKNFVVFADGVKVDENGMASEKIEIKNGKDLIVEVLQLSDGQSLTKLQHDLEQILVSLDAETVKELADRSTLSIGYKKDISTLNNSIKKYETKDAYLKQITDLGVKLSSKLKKPKEKQPDEDLEILLIKLSERLKNLNNTHKSIDKKYTDAMVNEKTCINHLADLQKDISELRVILSNHRKEFEMDDILALKFNQNTENLAKKQLMFKKLNDNKELQETTPEKRANTLEIQLDKFDDARTDVITLKERVTQLRDSKQLQDFIDLEANIEVEKVILYGLETDFSAFNLISSLARDSKDLHQEESRSDIKKEIDRLLSHVWGRDPNISLDDDGSALSSGLIPVEAESHGTKEQLQTIHRLVLLSKHSVKGTVMMLDDALVFASSGRLNRMKDVIQDSVDNKGMQFIIFSCRDGDYNDIGNKLISLDERRYNLI